MTSSNPNLPIQEQEPLPPYHNSDQIPTYTPESFHIPRYTYHLRATKPHVSHLVPYGSGTHTQEAPCYELTYRSTTALSLFTRKQPDISITHTTSNPLDPQGKSSVIVRADFHSDGPFPYCPRARLTLNWNAQQGEDQVVEMQAKDWKAWTFSFNGEPYVWRLRDLPSCLELSSTSSQATSTNVLVTARFTYGKVGTKVLAGGEVGTLEIWPDALTEGDDGVPAIIAGCVTVVKYFEGLGRRYRNDGSGGGAGASLIDARNQETTRVRSKFMLF